VLRAADVDRRSALRVGFRAVDVRPGCRVQDEVGREPRRRRRADVPVGVGERDDITPRERLDERVSELTAGAGD
jgi:hypothetical protein